MEREAKMLENFIGASVEYISPFPPWYLSLRLHVTRTDVTFGAQCES